MTEHPYYDAAAEIAASGIGSPLPLPYGSKYPPPAGYTGRAGVDPDAERIIRWAEGRPANVAIRLAAGVIGLDVDAYRGGAATIDRLAADLGPLADTTASTSRSDGSGIYLYRYDGPTDGWHDPGLGVDLIRRGHRYVVAPPSVHPRRGVYRWTDGAPRLDTLPTLPDAWAAYLADRRPVARTSRARAGRRPMTLPVVAITLG